MTGQRKSLGGGGKKDGRSRGRIRSAESVAKNIKKWVLSYPDTNFLLQGRITYDGSTFNVQRVIGKGFVSTMCKSLSI